MLTQVDRAELRQSVQRRWRDLGLPKPSTAEQATGNKPTIRLVQGIPIKTTTA